MNQHTKPSKIIFLLGIVSLLASLFWLFAYRWIQNPNLFADPYTWGPLIGIFMVFVPMLVVSLALLRRRLYQYLILAIVGALYLLFFGIALFTVGTLIIWALFFVYAVYSVNHELVSRYKISYEVLMQRSLTLLIMPLLIMVSVAYYNTPGIQKIAQAQKLPDSVQEVARYVANYVAVQQSVPIQDRAYVTQQVITQFTLLLKPYFKFFPPIIAFGLFLALQSLSFIFVTIGTVIGIMLFSLLRVSGLFTTEEYEVKAERILF